MNEITLQWVQLIKLIVIAIFATLYGFGGISGKWKRRFVGPIVLLIGVIGITLWTESFHWAYIVWPLLLCFSLSIGYGADNLRDKFIKRGRAGAAYATSALPLFIVNQSWLLMGLHFILCIGISIIMGVWNPTKSARAEETGIGFIIPYIPMFTI